MQDYIAMYNVQCISILLLEKNQVLTSVFDKLLTFCKKYYKTYYKAIQTIFFFYLPKLGSIETD